MSWYTRDFLSIPGGERRDEIHLVQPDALATSAR